MRLVDRLRATHQKVDTASAQKPIRSSIRTISLLTFGTLDPKAGSSSHLTPPLLSLPHFEAYVERLIPIDSCDYTGWFAVRTRIFRILCFCAGSSVQIEPPKATPDGEHEPVNNGFAYSKSS